MQRCKIPLKILAEFCNILENFAEILMKEKVCAGNAKISRIEEKKSAKYSQTRYFPTKLHLAKLFTKLNQYFVQSRQ